MLLPVRTLAPLCKASRNAVGLAELYREDSSRLRRSWWEYLGTCPVIALIPLPPTLPFPLFSDVMMSTSNHRCGISSLLVPESGREVIR